MGVLLVGDPRGAGRSDDGVHVHVEEREDDWKEDGSEQGIAEGECGGGEGGGR